MGGSTVCECQRYFLGCSCSASLSLSLSMLFRCFSFLLSILEFWVGWYLFVWSPDWCDGIGARFSDGALVDLILIFACFTGLPGLGR